MAYKQDERTKEVIQSALERFQLATGLIVLTEEDAEGRLMIRLHRAACALSFRVVCRPQVDRTATLHQVKDDLKQCNTPGLLVTSYLTLELARCCKALDLPFMDTAGNAFLKADDLLILIIGQKPDPSTLRKERPMRAFDRSGLKVVFAWLSKPELLQASYREVAKTAGVSPATVGWVLDNLKEHGFMVEDRQGKRRWIDPQRAMEAWCMNYPLRLRDKLHLKRYRAPNEDWWQEAHPEQFGACWSGEVAADKLLGDLAPKTATLYCQGDRKAFLNAHRLRLDPDGSIEILDAFWDFKGQVETTAPPLLIKADLLHLGDPRTIEQARAIHEKYLA